MSTFPTGIDADLGKLLKLTSQSYSKPGTTPSAALTPEAALTAALDIRAKSVEFVQSRLIVSTVDGEVLGLDLQRLPRLAAATGEERADWELMGGGRVIHWPQLDEDLSLVNLLPAAVRRLYDALEADVLASRSSASRSLEVEALMMFEAKHRSPKGRGDVHAARAISIPYGSSGRSLLTRDQGTYRVIVAPKVKPKPKARIKVGR